MSLAQLTCLGTCDGLPDGERGHSAYLYRLSGTVLLVDSGEPVARQLRARTIHPDEIDAVWLTHLHMDHIGGLFMLIQGFWLDGRKKPLPIYLPEEGVLVIQAMLRASYLFDQLLPFKISFIPHSAGQPVQIGLAKITPLLNSHLDQLRQSFGGQPGQRFESFSFRIETGTHTIAHTGDVGSLQDLDPLLDRDLDLLTCELSHLAPAALFEKISRANVRRAVFVHIGRALRKNLDELRRQADAALNSVPHNFAADGDEYHLTP